jgi:dihydrofolate reductase
MNENSPARKVVLAFGLTLDGYIARSDGAVDFLVGDQAGELSGKDIFLMGDGELARSFLTADLVDELVLGVLPILPGEGVPPFPSGFPERDFALLESKSNSNGSVTLKYGRIRAHAAPES